MNHAMRNRVEVQRLESILWRILKSSNNLLNEKVVLTNFPKTECIVDALSTSSVENLLSFLKVRAAKRDELTSLVGSKFIDEEISNWTSYCVKKALALLHGLIDVFAVHFDQLPSSIQLLELLIKWVELASLDRLESWYKSQSCYLLSLILRQEEVIGEMPSFPDWIKDRKGYIMGGWFWRYCRRCMREPLTPKVLAQFFAICNVKRAGYAISEEKQLEFLVKHIKNMNGELYKPILLAGDTQPGPVPSFRDTDEIIASILENLGNLIDIHFSGFRSVCKWKSPSVSACFEVTGAGGGPSTYFSRGSTANWSPSFIGYAHYRTRVTPIYVPYIPEELLTDLRAEYREKYMNRPLNRPSARVHKVLEPFKCRVITAGNAVPYHYGRLLQTQIFERMKRQPIFSLTGGPVTRRHIEESLLGVLLREEGTGSDDPAINTSVRSFVVAGDYDSATDGMNPIVCMRFCEMMYLKGYVNYEEYRVLRSCCEPHTLVYPDLTMDLCRKFGIDHLVVEGEDGSISCVQKWAQLMGSPISFIILCYANAAGLWTSAEDYEGRKLSYTEFVQNYCPLFNGDDISFVSNTVHYQIWKSVMSAIGLNCSVGKNYCSKDFAMINSEPFWLSRNQLGVIECVSDVFVCNPGLLKGQAKVLSDDRRPEVTIDSILPLVDQLNKAIYKSSPEQEQICRDIFYSHVMDRLKKTNRPWSAPRSLGGLGLDIGHLTYSQRKLIAYQMMEGLSGLGHEREVPGSIIISRSWSEEIKIKLGLKKSELIWSPPFQGPQKPAGKYFKSVRGIEDDDVELDIFFLGGEREVQGEDRYAKLLKDVLKHPWVTPISENFLKEHRGWIPVCDESRRKIRLDVSDT